jgi:hypothetical protein
MAKIHLLPDAGALDGTELVPVVKGGGTKKTRISSLVAAVVQPFVDLAHAWADGTLPGGAGTKSAKEWAQNSATSATTAQTYVNALTGVIITGAAPYETYALANAALGTIAANAYVIVLKDENNGGGSTYYQKSGGVLVFKALVIPSTYVRTWAVDPANGNDGNPGDYLLPFRSVNKAISVMRKGDRIIVLPNAAGQQVLKESINAAAAPIGEFDGSGCTIQLYDSVVPIFVNVSGDIWKADIALNLGNTGSRAPDGNKTYCGLFAGTEIYKVNNSTGTLTEAQAVTALNADVAKSYVVTNGPVYGGLPSGQTNGWANGNHTHYVKMAPGVDPNTLTWKVQQRRQPVFSPGWKLGNFSVFGGASHNGCEMMAATFTGPIQIWYPSNHGSFICGAQGAFWPQVIGRNPNGAAGYAWHMFNGGLRLRMTIANNAVAYGYNGPLDNLFGGHGSNQGNDICEGLIVNDLLAVDISSIGSPGECTYPMVLRRAQVFGMQSTGIGAGRVIDCTFVHTSTSPSNACWVIPSTGNSVSVEGGSSVGSPTAPYIRGYASSGTLGTLTFKKHNGICGGDTTFAQWFNSTAHAGVSFDKCILIADFGAHAAGTLGQANSGPVTFADTIVSGLTAPTGATFTRCARGLNVSALRGPRGEFLAPTEPGLFDLLGEVTIGVAGTPNVLTGSFQLTNKGVYVIGAANNVVGGPKWTALNAYTLNGIVGVYKTFTGNWIVAYGPNSTLLRYNVNDANTATPTVCDTSAFAGKSIVGAVAGGTDGKVWFGCSDGTIIEYDASTNTAVVRASGVTHPLTGGVRNGNTSLMCGSDAVGSTGTMGGAVRSTDGGLTWAIVLANTDAAPTGIGAWANRVHDASYDNGVYVMVCARGTMLTSTTAASGSWIARSLGTDIDIKTVTADTTKHRILMAGGPGLGPNYRGASMIYIDSSPADPANWAINPINCPLPAVGPKILFAASQTVGPQSLGQWIVTGPFARTAISEDPRTAFRLIEPVKAPRSYSAIESTPLTALLAVA